MRIFKHVGGTELNYSRKVGHLYCDMLRIELLKARSLKIERKKLNIHFISSLLITRYGMLDRTSVMTT